MRRVRKIKQRLSGYRYRKSVRHFDERELEDWMVGTGGGVKSAVSQA